MINQPPRLDPMLALLPAERPPAFERLPFPEQQWRGRCFLIFYAISGGRMGYAWWQALRDDDGSVEAFIRDRVTDDEIIAGLQRLEEANA